MVNIKETPKNIHTVCLQTDQTKPTKTVPLCWKLCSVNTQADEETEDFNLNQKDYKASYLKRRILFWYFTVSFPLQIVL